MVGSSVGHYKVTARLGAGGMGEVYRATDTRLGREVALKLLPPAMAHDDAARLRLIEEARNASVLNHPHICQIYDVNEAGGVTYFAMELAEGKPLSRHIHRGGMPAETVVRIGQQIAAALAHAHERGILHRDLKCSNVMVTPIGQAKVLDFGLAQRLEKGVLDDATCTGSTEHLAGPVAGTLPYLAPEVLRGQGASERSDIWALGVVLHEMTTGAKPFEAPTGLELVSAILRESPGEAEDAPPLLRGVIQRCLAKEPGQRYQQAAEVRAALEVFSPSGQARAAPPAAPAAPRSRRTWVALGGVVLVGGAVSLVVLQRWKQVSDPQGVATAPGSGSVGITALIAHPSTNHEANGLLQRAMMFTRFQGDPLRARPLLLRALELDPSFAEARANLALTYIVAVESGISNDPGDIYRAEEELRRVLKVDSELPRAHALLGAVHFFQGRVDLAIENSRRALQVAPRDLGANMWRVIEGRFIGDVDESLRRSRRLIESEPLFWPPRLALGELLRELGRTAEAVYEQETVLEQDAGNVVALRCLARAHLDAGNLVVARRTLERVRPADHRNLRVRMLRAQIYALEGNRKLAQKELDSEVLKYADLHPFSALDAAEVYAVLGDTGRAIEWLDRSMRKGDGRADWIRRDPLLSGVRGHPRFKQILSSMESRRQSTSQDAK
jgi:tetratricopeptide (TPR) repeat protein